MTETDPKPNDGKTNPTPQDEGTQEPRNDDPLDKFSQIKERYEKELSDKDKIIKDLQDKLSRYRTCKRQSTNWLRKGQKQQWMHISKKESYCLHRKKLQRNYA